MLDTKHVFNRKGRCFRDVHSFRKVEGELTKGLFRTMILNVVEFGGFCLYLRSLDYSSFLLINKVGGGIILL